MCKYPDLTFVIGPKLGAQETSGPSSDQPASSYSNVRVSQSALLITRSLLLHILSGNGTLLTRDAASLCIVLHQGVRYRRLKSGHLIKMKGCHYMLQNQSLSSDPGMMSWKVSSAAPVLSPRRPHHSQLFTYRSPNGRIIFLLRTQLLLKTKLPHCFTSSITSRPGLKRAT